MLNHHKAKYNEFCLTRHQNELGELENFINHLKTQKINCLKYNYSLDDRVQNFPSFQAFLQLSEDENFINIINYKPLDSEIPGFYECKSSSSFNLKNLNSFTFGGQSSRFWMLRKHINLMEKSAIPFYSW